MRLLTYVLSFVVAGVLIASPARLWGQAKKFTLSGNIYDSLTAKPIVNATVQIAGTKYTDTTKADGAYKIDNLIPGTNNLLVWAQGYDTAVVKFEIRKNMKLNAKLAPQPRDTMPPPADTVKPKADSVVKTITPPKPKKKSNELTDSDKEQLRVLIEDVIFSKSIYFSTIKAKKKSVFIEGSFSIDTGYLYEFEAKFARKNDSFELIELDFKMKGRFAQ